MRRINLGIVFLFASVKCFTISPADGDRMAQIITEYEHSWNEHSARGFTDNFAKKGGMLDLDNEYYDGKKAIEKRYIDLHDSVYKLSTYTIDGLELHEIHKDLVMAYVPWYITQYSEQADLGKKKTIKGITSHVFIKEDGEWKISATHNALKN